MNIFKKESALFGYADGEHLNQTMALFLQQAREIRERLGQQRHLLDRYLAFLFEATNLALTYNVTSNGFYAAGQLSGMCLGEVLGVSKHTDHAFYETVKDYIQTHPLTFREPQTRAAVYYSLLNSDFLKIAAEQYSVRIEEDILSVLAPGSLHDLYAVISGLLGEEKPMEELNRLFRERFLIASAMTVFLQELTRQLLLSLSCYDSESSKQVFQLILDDIKDYAH